MAEVPKISGLRRMSEVVKDANLGVKQNRISQELVQLADLLMDLQERVSGMLEDAHRSSGVVSDPIRPSGGGSRLRLVQFRMPRRLACIVGLFLVSGTEFLIYTVDPRDWTTNQIDAV